MIKAVNDSFCHCFLHCWAHSHFGSSQMYFKILILNRTVLIWLNFLPSKPRFSRFFGQLYITQNNFSFWKVWGEEEYTFGEEENCRKVTFTSASTQVDARCMSSYMMYHIDFFQCCYVEHVHKENRKFYTWCGKVTKLVEGYGSVWGHIR